MKSKLCTYAEFVEQRREAERKFWRRWMLLARGKVSVAARGAGWRRQELYKKLEALGIDRRTLIGRRAPNLIHAIGSYRDFKKLWREKERKFWIAHIDAAKSSIVTVSRNTGFFRTTLYEKFKSIGIYTPRRYGGNDAWKALRDS